MTFPKIRQCGLNKMVRRDNCFVIMGCVGAGKTSLVDWLSLTYGCGRARELARDLIAEKAVVDAALLPWHSTKSFLEFETELLERRILQFISITSGITWFADTGIPNSLVFFRKSNIEPPKYVIDACRLYRYNRRVFYLPPWREIFFQDESRPQSFEESCEIGELACEVYQDLGYEVTYVDFGTLDERASFILNTIAGAQ